MALVLVLTLTFMATLLVVVVPAMMIDDTGDHRIPDPVVLSADDMAASTQQEIYLLFILPAAAVVNAVVLYVVYYRHVRYVHYRTEVSRGNALNLVSATKPILTQYGLHFESMSAAPPPPGVRETAAVQPTFRSGGAFDHDMEEFPPLTVTSYEERDFFPRNRPEKISRRHCPRPLLPALRRLIDVVDGMTENHNLLVSNYANFMLSLQSISPMSTVSTGPAATDQGRAVCPDAAASVAQNDHFTADVRCLLRTAAQAVPSPAPIATLHRRGAFSTFSDLSASRLQRHVHRRTLSAPLGQWLND